MLTNDNAIWVCTQLIFRASYCASAAELEQLYDVANEICDRDTLGDELVDDVYGALAVASDLFA